MYTAQYPAPESATVWFSGLESASEPLNVAFPPDPTTTVPYPSPPGLLAGLLLPGRTKVYLPVSCVAGLVAASQTARYASKSATPSGVLTVPLSICAPARSNAIVTVHELPPTVTALLACPEILKVPVHE